jgi:hypothetical protein
MGKNSIFKKRVKLQKNHQNAPKNRVNSITER